MMVFAQRRDKLESRRHQAAALLGALCVCAMAGGCRVPGGVDSVRRTIAESTANLQAINRTITNSLPTLEAATGTIKTADREIQSASQTLAGATPAITNTLATLEKTRRTVEQSCEALDNAVVLISHTHDTIEESARAVESTTASINGIDAAVIIATGDIEQLCLSLSELQEALDLVFSRKGAILFTLVTLGLLILVLLLAGLISNWTLARGVSLLAARLDKLQGWQNPGLNR